MSRFLSVAATAIVAALLFLVSGCSGGGGTPIGPGAWVPQITALNPSIVPTGSPATTINITGSQILDGAEVYLGTVRVNANQINPNQIQAFVPASELTTEREVDVTVKNPNGNVSNALKFGIGTSTQVPTITSLSPNSATAGSGATVVTVTGTNFAERSVVRWNGQNRATLFVSSTELRFTATPADLATAGTAQVSVFNSPPGGGTSGNVTFTIN